MKAHLQLAFIAALACAPGFAGANANGMTAKLARGGVLACQPALPYFCANIHVSCAGRSATGTFAFQLRVAGDRGWIESAADASGIGILYENARVDWGGEGAYVLLRPRQGKGYVKVLATGEYSFRLYAQEAAMMSRGRCD